MDLIPTASAQIILTVISLISSKACLMHTPHVTDSIGEATAEDYAGMSRVIVACLLEVNAKDYPPQVINDLVDLLSPEKIGNYLQGKYVIALKRHGEVIGTGSLSGSEITLVFVQPAIHGHGNGRKIMQALESQASLRGLDSVEIHASLSSVEFYEKLGYQHLKRIERQLRGESFHMIKTLNT
jgi:GNAT superfamily N-acetyltransferase